MLHTLEVDSADSPRPTRGWVTGIRLLDTSLALTNESLLTVRVNDTLGLTPGDGVGVGDEAGLTSADGVTIASDGALGSRSAWRRVTRIWLHDTSLALANVSLLAVGVNDTLRPAASDSVGLGDEAGLTRANRVA